MSVIIKAHYDGKTIVPDAQLDLAPDQPLEVEIRVLAADKPSDAPRPPVDQKLDITSLPVLWNVG